MEYQIVEEEKMEGAYLSYYRFLGEQVGYKTKIKWRDDLKYARYPELQSIANKYFSNLNRYIKYIDFQDVIFTMDMEMHNETGPAWIRIEKEHKRCFAHYYLFGKELTKEEWQKQLQTKLYW